LAEEAPLRILMVAPTPFFADRGCHVRILEEARTLQSLGHDVEIVTYHLGRDITGIPVHRTVPVPWYRKLEAGPSWHKIYLDILLMCKVIAVAARFRPHILHAHLHEGALIGSIARLTHHLPLVFDYQGSLTEECIDHGFFAKTSLLARVFATIEYFINNCADAIITSSRLSSDRLSHDSRMTCRAITPIIDGVDTDVFVPREAAPLRQELGLPADTTLIAYLGLLNQYQGIDLLLESIALLKSRNIQAQFLIMGFPEERYKDEATKRGLSDYIIFTGKIDYALAPRYLACADMAISPKLSLTEANGKLFNYMACGLPVVVFDTPVNREILDDSGVYAAYGDAVSFADRIAELLDNRECLSRHAANVRERAVNVHSWRSRGHALLGLYRSLLAGRTGQA